MIKITMLLCLLGATNTKGQSPSLRIRVSMDSVTTKQGQFKISMKICEQVKGSAKDSWFTKDTSAIDFIKLRPEDVKCGSFMENGDGMEILSGGKTFTVYNSYEYSQQRFAWESILVFRITNESSAAWWPPMYIILPVKYKSFVTHISLTGIIFQSDKIFFLDHPDAAYHAATLFINQDCRLSKGVDPSLLPDLQFLLN